MAFPWRKLKNISTAGKGGHRYVHEKATAGNPFPLYAQEALHQASAQVGELSMEAVPLGYTQTGRLKSAKNRPI